MRLARVSEPFVPLSPLTVAAHVVTATAHPASADSTSSVISKTVSRPLTLNA
jgi:hypothetical protein